MDPRQLAAQLDGARALGPAHDGHRRAAIPPTSASPATRGPTRWAIRTWTIPPSDKWFNTAAFAVPVNQFGNAERNSLRAPSYWNVDLGLQKNVPLGQQPRAAGPGGGLQRLQPHQRGQSPDGGRQRQLRPDHDHERPPAPGPARGSGSPSRFGSVSSALRERDRPRCVAIDPCGTALVAAGAPLRSRLAARGGAGGTRPRAAEPSAGPPHRRHVPGPRRSHGRGEGGGLRSDSSVTGTARTAVLASSTPAPHPSRIREVVLFDVVHGLPAETALYGEGFQMLSQTGGTLGAPARPGRLHRRSATTSCRSPKAPASSTAS